MIRKNGNRNSRKENNDESETANDPVPFFKLLQRDGPRGVKQQRRQENKKYHVRVYTDSRQTRYKANGEAGNHQQDRVCNLYFIGQHLDQNNDGHKRQNKW